MPDKFLESITNPDILYNLLNKPEKPKLIYPNFLGNDSLPVTDRPGIFRKYPEVVGSPEFARSVDRILTTYPELRDKSRRITYGPDSGAINELLQSNFTPYDYEKTNLLGTYTPGDTSISISPRVTGDKLIEVLIHELAHSRGASEPLAYATANVIPKSLKTKTY